MHIIIIIIIVHLQMLEDTFFPTQIFQRFEDPGILSRGIPNRFAFGAYLTVGNTSRYVYLEPQTNGPGITARSGGLTPASYPFVIGELLQE